MGVKFTRGFFVKRERWFHVRVASKSINRFFYLFWSILDPVARCAGSKDALKPPFFTEVRSRW